MGSTNDNDRPTLAGGDPAKGRLVAGRVRGCGRELAWTRGISSAGGSTGHLEVVRRYLAAKNNSGLKKRRTILQLRVSKKSCWNKHRLLCDKLQRPLDAMVGQERGAHSGTGIIRDVT